MWKSSHLRRFVIIGVSIGLASVIELGISEARGQEFRGTGYDPSIAELNGQEQFLAEEEERLRLKQRNLEMQQELVELQERINKTRELELGLDDRISSPLSLPEGVSSETLIGPAVDSIPLQSKIRTIDASRRAIDQIISDLKDIPDISSLVVYNQEDFGKLKFYLLYETLRRSLVDSYLGELRSLSGTPESDTAGGRGIPLAAGASTLLSSSKTVLRSLVELLSFFRSQDTITFNEYNPGGNSKNVDFLVAQLVSKLRQVKRNDIKVYSPSLYWVDMEYSGSRLRSQTNTLKKVIGNLDELKQLRQESEKVLESYGIGADYPSDSLARDPLSERLRRLLTLNQKAQELENFIDGISLEVLTSAPSVVEDDPGLSEDAFAKAPDNSSPFILELLEGAQIHEVLKEEGSYALLFEVLASGGSQRIRQSLFTTIFTGSRLSYNGGIAIQYFLLDKDNSIKTADVVYYNTGFKGAGTIHRPSKKN